MPIWLSGEYPDDPDLLRCDRHIGSLINGLVVLLKASRIYVDRMTIQAGPCPHDELWQARDLLKRIDVMLHEVRWETRWITSVTFNPHFTDQERRAELRKAAKERRALAQEGGR